MEVQITSEEKSKFKKEGFLIRERLIDPSLAKRLGDRFEDLFAGRFETGVYPVEWHWREGMSLPNITREICNAYKSDRTIASVVLSSVIGRLIAELADWPGTRIGQDDIWWKPPGTQEIALHQDAMYFHFLDPSEVITCWIALDDTSADVGTLEYVHGSHLWPLEERVAEFHAPDNDYRGTMRTAANRAGADVRISQVIVPAGGCSFHHGNTWHGSGKNTNDKTQRRSLAIHALRADTCFRPNGVGYIYGRYKRPGDTKMDEAFFPILWTKDGYRTPFLKDYCPDALA